MANDTSLTNDEIKHQILNVYAKFVSDVEPDRLSDWLVQEHVITIVQKQRIRQENPTASDRCRALLDHLFSIHHPRAFLVVRQALRKENHYLLEYIDNQERDCLFGEHPEKNAVLQAKIQELENHLMISRSENTQLRKKEGDLKQRVHELEAELHTDNIRIQQLEKNYKDQQRAWKSEKEQLLQKQKKLETKLQQGELRYISNPVLVHTIEPKAAEGEKKAIVGLARLDRELFVLSNKSSEVEVYDSMKFSFRRRWNLKELSDPFDLVSCNRNKCLYMFDSKGIDMSDEILRVDPYGILKKKWSTGGGGGGTTLSLTEESNVISTFHNKSKLHEYTPNGQLIREINLSNAGIRDPWHAIKLTNGHFMVCNGICGHGHDDDLHRVCIVDADGKLEKSFGGKCGSTKEQMNFPVHLSVDGNGFVMVVDHRNSRVLLLNSDLKFEREILSKEHGLRRLNTILLDESKGRLFVADSEWNTTTKKLGDGRILIFDF